MTDQLQITSGLLTKNWMLNMLGQMLPLVFAVLATPYVIRGLGTERFGVLSIAWALLSYTAILDLGLSRATTKFAAEHLARGEYLKLSGTVRSSLRAQSIIGIGCAAVAAGAAPLLANKILNISPSLRAETLNAFLILSISLPVVLVGNVFRGLLEAGQRFDLVNSVRMPTNTSIFLIPAAAVPLRLNLPAIVFLLIVTRLGATIAYFHFCCKCYPALLESRSYDSCSIRSLLNYGRWVTISNMLEPLLTYVDRFFIGSILSVSMVAYYTAPYDAITRAWVIPSSLTAAVFPAFSSLSVSNSDKRLEQLCIRSLKSLLLTLGPMLFLIVFFAHFILHLWLGETFASKSTTVLQILALGVLVNSLAFVPLSLLHGLGRPDLSAKIHLIELPFYIIALVYGVQYFGITGAAVAWTIRVCADAVLQFGAVAALRVISRAAVVREGLLRSAAVVAALGSVLFAIRFAGQSIWLANVVATAAALGFVVIAWKYLLDGRDRSLVLSVTGQLKAAVARAK